jgi:hypothetical protein
MASTISLPKLKILMLMSNIEYREKSTAIMTTIVTSISWRVKPVSSLKCRSTAPRFIAI